MMMPLIDLSSCLIDQNSAVGFSSRASTATRRRRLISQNTKPGFASLEVELHPREPAAPSPAQQDEDEDHREQRSRGGQQ